MTYLDFVCDAWIGHFDNKLVQHQHQQWVEEVEGSPHHHHTMASAGMDKIEDCCGAVDFVGDVAGFESVVDIVDYFGVGWDKLSSDNSHILWVHASNHHHIVGNVVSESGLWIASLSGNSEQFES